MVSFGGQSTFDNAESESGVTHESVTYTDNSDATVLKRGYDYSSFDEIGPTPTYCWPMHEDSGSTVHDVAGTVDGNTPNGAAFGQSALLDFTSIEVNGIGEYVTFGSGIGEGVSALSVAMWVYFPSSPSGTERLLTNDNNNVFRTSVGSSTNYEVRVTDSNGNWLSTTTSSNSLLTDTWQHLAMTWDGSTLVAYVDGSQDGSTSASASSTNAPSDTTNFGADSTGGNNCNVRGADVRIYEGTALSASDVQSLYDVVTTNGTLTTQAQTV